MESSGFLAGASGVLHMDLIAEIWRRHVVSKGSISSIARAGVLDSHATLAACIARGEARLAHRKAMADHLGVFSDFSPSEERRAGEPA